MSATELATPESVSAQPVAAPTSATPSVVAASEGETDFWSSRRIAEIADNVSQSIGADQNDLGRTLFVALTDQHFMPVCAYPYLLLARRALVGVAMMIVAALADPAKTKSVPYTFDVGYVPGASKLVEIWTVRSDDKIVVRYMLAPSSTMSETLVRAEASLAVYSVKTESRAE